MIWIDMVGFRSTIHFRLAYFPLAKNHRLLCQSDAHLLEIAFRVVLA